jgi:hypothetical protein
LASGCDPVYQNNREEKNTEILAHRAAWVILSKPHGEGHMIPKIEGPTKTCRLIELVLITLGPLSMGELVE